MTESRVLVYSCVKWYGIPCTASVCCWKTLARYVIAEGNGFCQKHPGEMSNCDEVGARQDSCMMNERANVLTQGKISA